MLSELIRQSADAVDEITDKVKANPMKAIKVAAASVALTQGVVSLLTSINNYWISVERRKEIRRNKTNATSE